MSIRNDITSESGFFVGEDKGLRFTVIDQRTDKPVNITGFTLQFELTDEQFGEELFTLVSPFVAMIDAPNGVCQVNIAQGLTISLLPGTYWYSLRKTNLGSASELAYGSLELLDVFTNYP